MENRPDLDDGGMLIARAYAQLSSCRAIGAMGIGPIPVTAVWQWEDRNGIADRGVREHFEAVISAIDTNTLQRANRPLSKNDGKIDKQAEAPPRQRRRLTP